MHDVQLLRQGLPAEYRHIGDVYGGQLFYALRKQGYGALAGGLAGGQARQTARRQMRRLRKLRKGVPSAYRNTQRAEKIGEGALLKRFCFKTGLVQNGQSRFSPRRNCGFVSGKRRSGLLRPFRIETTI